MGGRLSGRGGCMDGGWVGGFGRGRVWKWLVGLRDGACDQSAEGCGLAR